MIAPKTRKKSQKPSAENSRLKMKLMLKNGNDHLKKIDNKTGQLANPAFFNFPKENKLSDDTIFDKMHTRIKKLPYYDQIQVLIMYCTKTGNEIKKILL